MWDYHYIFQFRTLFAGFLLKRISWNIWNIILFQKTHFSTFICNSFHICGINLKLRTFLMNLFHISEITQISLNVGVVLYSSKSKQTWNKFKSINSSKKWFFLPFNLYSIVRRIHSKLLEMEKYWWNFAVYYNFSQTS